MNDIKDVKELTAVVCTKFIIAIGILAGLWIIVGNFFIFLINGVGRVVGGIEHVVDSGIDAVAGVLGVMPSMVWGIAGAVLLVIFVLFVAAVAFAMALRAIRTARYVDMDSDNILLFNGDNTTAVSFSGANITSRIVEEARGSGELTPAEAKILAKLERRRPSRQIVGADKLALEKKELKLLKGGE
jgi:hypothetical protein